MAAYILVLACMVACASSLPLAQEKSSPVPLPFEYFTKVDWGGRPARGGSELSLPVPFVVIHHSYIPGACFNAQQCMNAMRWMQTFHMDDQGWTDIGYNFAVGSDGAVYEGRGWNTVGAHAVGYNVQSIGIVFIGDWVSNVPPPKQLQAAKDLIDIGVMIGYISPEYSLIGHRQVSATECPGESLYKEISGWERFLYNLANKA